MSDTTNPNTADAGLLMACVDLTPEADNVPARFWHLPVVGFTDHGTPLVVNNDETQDLAAVGLPWTLYETNTAAHPDQVRMYAQHALGKAREAWKGGQA